MNGKFIFGLGIVASFLTLGVLFFLFRSEVQEKSPNVPTFLEFQVVVTKEGENLGKDDPIMIDKIILNRGEIESFSGYDFKVYVDELVLGGGPEVKKYRVTALQMVSGKTVYVRETMEMVDYVLRGFNDAFDFDRIVKKTAPQI